MTNEYVEYFSDSKKLTWKATLQKDKTMHIQRVNNTNKDNIRWNILKLPKELEPLSEVIVKEKAHNDDNFDDENNTYDVKVDYYEYHPDGTLKAFQKHSSVSVKEEKRPITINIKKVYETLIKELPKFLYLQKPIEYKLFTLWCISTYKYTSFNSTGYLAFLPCDTKMVNGIGKSRAMKLIEKIANRGIKGVDDKIDISENIKCCKEYNATITIDDIQKILNNSKSGNNVHVWLLNNYSGNEYRFKAIAGTKKLNKDILTRCMTFCLENHKMKEKLEKHKDFFTDVKTQLNIYKLFKPVVTTETGFAQWNRTEEIFGNLIAIAKDIGIDYKDIVEYALNWEKQYINVENSNDIITVINKFKDDTIKLNDVFKKMGITTMTEKQQMGKKMKKMGFIVYRKEFGRVIIKSENTQILQNMS